MIQYNAVLVLCVLAAKEGKKQLTVISPLINEMKPFDVPAK